MSDLQCPVRVLLASQSQATEHIEPLRSERVALVVARVESQAAQQVAHTLQAQVSARPDPLATVLDEVADTFRGETVLVISHASAIRTFLDSYVPHALGHRWQEEVAVVAVEGDSAGWRSARPIR